MTILQSNTMILHSSKQKKSFRTEYTGYFCAFDSFAAESEKSINDTHFRISMPVFKHRAHEMCNFILRERADDG